MSKNTQLEILRWSGLMGHRFVVIIPDARPDNLYGGWRCRTECNSLPHALDAIQQFKDEGARIFQKVAKRGKYGAVKEEWREVTPKAVAA